MPRVRQEQCHVKRYEIVNIRRGTGDRSIYLYADVIEAESRELYVSAEFDYCVRWVRLNS
jgi:hypothetical protein